MATNRINPSRNANDNETRQSYGYVIRVEDISKIEPHATIVGFTVFNQADGCFYRCEEVNDTTEHLQYYTWKAVTFGAHRAYLMPVGKLTVADIGYTTEKDQIGCIGNTINELVFQFVRYNKYFDPVGYEKITGHYLSGKDYYKWSWNDTISGISLDTHKIYTGEFKKLIAGTDYEIGDLISSDVYIKDGTVGISWSSVDMILLCEKLNKMIDELNVHGAGIPPVYTSNTYNRLSQVLNLFIDEVNPFSVPWQLLLNRMNTLEGSVGHASLQTTHITEEKLRETTNISKWYDQLWRNYVTEFTTENPQLFYGTVCQAIDSALNVIKFLDTKIGSISSIPNIGSRTFAQYVYEIDRRRSAAGNSDAIEQVRKSLFDEATDTTTRGIGYSCANVDGTQTFASGVNYYVWYSITDDDDRHICYYRQLSLEESEYEIGGNIAAWEAIEGHTRVYVWDSSRTAARLIKGCESAISSLNTKFDKLVGSELQTIYTEVVGSITAGLKYVYLSAAGELTEFVALEGKTLDEYRELYASPIYKALDNEELTGLLQIAKNNREMMRIIKAAMVSNKEITGNRARCEKMFTETGMKGTLSDVSTWTTLGYTTIPGGSNYESGQKYYRYNPSTDTLVEMTEGVDYIVPSYRLTSDIICDATSSYYIKRLDGTFRIATKGTSEQVSSGTADYYIGMPVPSNMFYEFYNPTPVPEAIATYIRLTNDKDKNTHRGLIDRNTEHVREVRSAVLKLSSDTGTKMKSMKSLVLSITMATLEVIEKDETTLPKLTGSTLEFAVITIFKVHNMLNRLITIHNAIDMADGYFPMRPASGTYSTGFAYYIPNEFALTTDSVVQDGKTYFTKEGDVYTYAPVCIGDTLSDGKLYYNAGVWREMVAGRDYEYGQIVTANVFTKDFVLCPTENYNLEDVRRALDSVILFHKLRKELPAYVEYPSDEIIQGGRTYWKYDAGSWRKIVPEIDDPEMIGKRIEEYDSGAIWYIKFDDTIAADKYVVTDSRIMLNELIKIHRKGS